MSRGFVTLDNENLMMACERCSRTQSLQSHLDIVQRLHKGSIFYPCCHSAQYTASKHLQPQDELSRDMAVFDAVNIGYGKARPMKK
jgi:hypothetical protein